MHEPQVVGQIGMWGTLVSGIQAFVLERDLVALAPWDSGTSGWIQTLRCNTLTRL